jgi:chromosome partitioning protein
MDEIKEHQYQTLEKNRWTIIDAQKLYRLKSRHTLISAESRGELPEAARESRGSTQVRIWSLDQLPFIGAKYGFMEKPKKQVVICVYTPKGGVLKTATTGNLARISALNGLNVLVIGLDFQKSVTNYLYPTPQFELMEDLRSYIQRYRSKGLYDILFKGAKVEEVVHKTSIPTLDIIPETSDLIAVERALRSENRREYVFKDLIDECFSKYDLIIMDNTPAWTQLTECSLTAANNLLSPLGCDYETFQALGENFIHIQNFKNKMKLDWDNYLIIPTLLENNNISREVYELYKREFGEMILPFPIRRTVKGQEARVSNMSVFEYEPTSELSNDYYNMIVALWERVLMKINKK